MGWKFVVQENGKFALFSTIPDQFIAWDMSEEEAVQFVVDNDVIEARRRAEKMIALAREGGAARTNDVLEDVRDKPTARTWRKRFAVKDPDLAPPPRTASARESDRNRLVRLARERLALARETEDADAAEAARAVLASLGVDEAGDDLQPGEVAT